MDDFEALERARRIQQSTRLAEQVIALIFYGVLVWVISGLSQ